MAVAFLVASDAVKADGPFDFFALTPCRIADTRGLVGPSGGPALAANTIRSFPVDGVNNCGVPLAATAAVFNVTAIQATDVGDFRIFPYQTPPGLPLASVLNFSPQDLAIANGAIIPLANISGPRISVWTDMPSGSSGHVDLILDVTGYFLPTAAAASSVEKKATVAKSLLHAPLYFIENRGQFDPRVAYAVQGRTTALYFTSDGMTLVQTEEGPPSRSAVKLDFLGANPHAKILPGDPRPAIVSYFRGPREKWKAGIPTWGSITYTNLWPGIDLLFSGDGRRLEYTFLVRPGADPDRIQLAYRGAASVRLNRAGQLAVETALGGFVDDRPLAYQETGDGRAPVEASYLLSRPRRDGSRRFGFAVGTYDRSRTLLLDPAVLVYAGTIGGDGNDAANAIAVDGSGNAYVAGSTASTQASFPVTVGPDTTFNGGNYDAFVAKVNAAGTGLVYAGYIGGSGDDFAYGIAVDGSGSAYVTGYTGSNQATFPVTAGPGMTFSGGNYDAFVAKVNAAGTALVYCGYIGGAGSDIATGIAVDGAGAAYVVGSTDSTQATFPVTVGPDVTHNGNLDVFVAKVTADGTGLIYAGYIGGSEVDEPGGIAVDGLGNAYVTGSTYSTETTFPVKVGPGLKFKGFLDAFVAKVSATGSELVYCGYIGGDNATDGLGITVDGSGAAYVTGDTSCDETSFPVAIGPDLSYNGGGIDAYIAKVQPDGSGLVYCGYIGGVGNEDGRSVAVDASGNAYVTGGTSSTEASFPVLGGPDLTYNGGVTNAFVAEVAAAGDALLYCGYVGQQSSGMGIALDGSGSAYVAGTAGADALVAKVATTPDTGATSFYRVYPCRVADTRNPPGPLGGPALDANTVRSFPVAGVCGVPIFARAVAVNLTVFQPSNDGDLRVFPAGASAPLASAINFRPGIVRAGNAIVPLGAGGQISVQCDMPSGATHFFFDVYGYFQ